MHAKNSFSRNEVRDLAGTLTCANFFQARHDLVRGGEVNFLQKKANDTMVCCSSAHLMQVTAQKFQSLECAALSLNKRQDWMHFSG